MQRSWPASTTSGELRSYQTKQADPTTHAGCLLWASRVVIPPPLRHRVLEQLHEGHTGAARMKSLALTTCHWPNIDEEINQQAKSCESCARVPPDLKKEPPRTWAEPARIWARLHADFAGPFCGAMWLTLVDAKTCWPEVRLVSEATSEKMIDALQDVFYTHSLPDVLVTGNGTQFSSDLFRNYVL